VDLIFQRSEGMKLYSMGFERYSQFQTLAEKRYRQKHFLAKRVFFGEF
jgi:hypothetical protein